MSSEELVVAIRSGETERMVDLWGQISGLVKWKAKQIISILEGRPGRGVDFDDLYQSGYLALVDAVNTYDIDVGSGFVTWFMYHLKKAFADAAGYRTQKGLREPLNNCLSLDAPLDDSADAGDLMEVVADPAGQKGQEAAEEIIWLKELREAVGAAMSSIPENYREVLRLRYWENMTLEDIGKIRGVGKERVRQMENKGIRLLKQPHNACSLLPFYDFDFYSGAGYRSFARSGMSIQDRYLVAAEDHRKREERRMRKQERRKARNGECGWSTKMSQKEAQEIVSRMTPEEKKALLEKHGLV